jgi:hypothetical protein
MKWLFWRRKPKAEAVSAEAVRGEDVPSHAPVFATRVGAVADGRPRSAPLSVPVELRDTLLAFARDVLVASGARVRVEATDVLLATLPDGAQRRYTTTLARARDEQDTELLVVGGTALAGLLEECARHSRLTALRLATEADPVALAREACALPVSGCAKCGGTADAPRCERCPARAGGLTLRGLGRVTRALELRRWTAWQVELTYRVSCRDRQERNDEWLRIGVDLEGLDRLDPLDTGALARAESATPPANAEALLRAAMQSGAESLDPALTAAAAVARLRSAADFHRRLEDIGNTFDRLAREETGAHAALTTARQREIERLREVFAVDVEAQLESACFVETTLAEVELRLARGGLLTLTVDLGRAQVRPPRCVVCARPANVGSVCHHGHFTCAACAGEPDGACAACAGDLARSRARPAARGEHEAGESLSLTVEQVDALTPGMWAALVRWLLERDGATVERVDHGATEIVLYGGGAEGHVVAVAQRLPAGWALGEVEVKRAASLCAGSAGAHAVLMSNAPASAQARAAASRLGVQLLDREYLRERLTVLAQSYQRARENASREAAACANAAATAREQVLAVLHSIDELLADAAANNRRVTGAGIAGAVAAIIAARQSAERALLAWETFADDWLSSFADREGRDGSLVITADLARLSELGERAGHLGAALRQCCAVLAQSPGMGALGYSAWRKAVLEELTARSEALRWRALAVDPAQWRDFRAARDAQALAQAEVAASAASHASARAAKSYAQLETRARLPASRDT